MLLRRLVWLLCAGAAALLPLTACTGPEDAAAGSSSTVTVTAGDSRCELDRVQLQPGSTTFKVTNKGTQVTEVYVYGDAGGAYTKVVSEVENIGPGLSRDLTVELSPGTYEVACKPGQTGSGIRTKVTVAGSATASPTEEDADYDRELVLSSDGHTIQGNLAAAQQGEAIEFKLTNRSDRPLILEVKDPTDAVAGESGPIPPNKTGEIIVELKVAGAWTIIAESDEREDITTTLTVS